MIPDKILAGSGVDICGGLGMRLDIRLTSPATLYRFIEKSKSPHWGIDGGMSSMVMFRLKAPGKHMG